MAYDSPILRCQSWQDLLTALRDSPWAVVSSLDERTQRLALVAPATVARAIATLVPELRRKTPLKLYIAGNSEYRVADHGRWFHLIPWMLGVPETHFEGVLVDVKFRQYLSTELSKDATWAALSKIQVAQDFDDLDSASDAVLLLNPAFHRNPDWLENDWLEKYLQDKNPVLVADYEFSESEDDQWAAGLAGWGALESPLQNPYGLAGVDERLAKINRMVMGTRMASSLMWRLAVVAKPAASHLRHRWFSAIRTLDQLRQTASRKPDAYDQMDGLMAWGMPLEGYPVEPDRTINGIVLPEGAVLDRQTGTVFDIDPELPASARRVEGIRVPAGVLAEYPEALLFQNVFLPAHLWAIWAWEEFCLSAWQAHRQRYGHQ